MMTSTVILPERDRMEITINQGLIVKHDDEAGYMIIGKPPKIPVHTRVDYLLKSMASCKGMMPWMERQGGGQSNLTSLSNDGKDSTGVGIDDGNLREDNNCS